MGTYLSTPSKIKKSENGFSSNLIRYGVSSMQGWRMTMEDSHIILVDDFKGHPDLHIFGVFDGHGGGHVARFVADHFADELQKIEEFQRGSYENALRRVFMTIDSYLFKKEYQGELETLAYCGRSSSRKGDLHKYLDSKSAVNETDEASQLAEDNIPVYMRRFDTVSKSHMEGILSESVYDEEMDRLNCVETCRVEEDNGARVEIRKSRLEEQRDNEILKQRENEKVGDRETGKVGDRETGKVGDRETGKLGDRETGKLEAADTNKESTNNRDFDSMTDASSHNVNYDADMTVCDEDDCTNTLKGLISDAHPNQPDNETVFESDSELSSGEEGSASAARSNITNRTLRDNVPSSPMEYGSSSRVAKAARKSLKGKTGHTPSTESSNSIDNYDLPKYTTAADPIKTETPRHTDITAKQGGEDSVYTQGRNGVAGLFRSLVGIKDSIVSIFGSPRMNIRSARRNLDSLATYSGCTANVVIIAQDRLIVANAGDSRCVLCRGTSAIDLSIDHKPQLQEEKRRIHNAGGYLEMGRVNGNLNLSRALGDLAYKQDTRLSQEKQIVTAFPDICCHDIQDEDEFLVIGCDGIFEKEGSSQFVVDFVRTRIEMYTDLSGILEELFDELLSPNPALVELGCDNMTATIVDFKRKRSENRDVSDIKGD